MLAATVAALIGIAAAVLLVFGESADKKAARAAGDAVEQRVAGLGNGEAIDLATALDQPWQRAVVMHAYMSGDEMNAGLGFRWFDDDQWSSYSDESQRLLFVADQTVVADVMTGPETFFLDDAVTELDPSAATLIASRDADDLVTLGPAGPRHRQSIGRDTRALPDRAGRAMHHSRTEPGRYRSRTGGASRRIPPRRGLLHVGPGQGDPARRRGPAPPRGRDGSDDGCGLNPATSSRRSPPA